MENKRPMKVANVAAILEDHEQNVRYWIRRGLLKAQEHKDKPYHTRVTYLLDADDVLAFLRTKGVEEGYIANIEERMQDFFNAEAARDRPSGRGGDA